MESTEPGSIRAQIAAVHANAIRVRPHMSPEALRRVAVLEQLSERLASEPEDAPLEDLLDLCMALAGTAAENMVRGHAFYFLDLGRRIERAICLSWVGSSLDRPRNQVLKSVLELSDCRMVYRARYRSRLQASPVFDLLFCDPSNPRGLSWQIETIESRIGTLPLGLDGSDRVARSTRKLSGRARLLDPVAMADGQQPMDQAMTAMRKELEELSSLIDLQYFSHAVPPRFWALGWPNQ